MRASQQFIDGLSEGDKVGVERINRGNDMMAYGTVTRITPSRNKIVVETQSGRTFEFNKRGTIPGGTWDPSTDICVPDDDFAARFVKLGRASRVSQLASAMRHGVPQGMDDEQTKSFDDALLVLQSMYIGREAK
jgi:hypothetical protein